MTTQITKTLALAISLLFSIQMTGSDIELRFNATQHDVQNDELHVSIEVRYTQAGQYTLAGQNYRFYYDSETMTMSEEAIDLNLSRAVYGDVQIDAHTAGISADRVNQITFDDNLGFVNFSVSSNNKAGGLTITEEDGWVSVASLKFELERGASSYDIVWGRNGMSDLYATAFVEIAQQVGGSNIAVSTISSYGDLSYEVSASRVAEGVNVQVGPNPTSDYVRVSLEEVANTQTTISFVDMTGKQVKQSTITAGNASATIDMTDLNSAAYTVIIAQEGAGMIHNTQVIVAR